MLTRCHYWPACIIIAYAMRFDLVLHTLKMDIAGVNGGMSCIYQAIRNVREAALRLSTTELV